MNEKTWIFIVIALAAVAALMIYQMRKEKKFRDNMRQNMGAPTEDALLNSEVPSVRDGKTIHIPDEANTPYPVKDLSKTEPAMHSHVNNVATAKPTTTKPIVEIPVNPQPEVVAKVEDAPADWHSEPEPANEHIKVSLSLADMMQQELSWFDQRFDYLVYIALNEAQELKPLPRFSSMHRVKSVGCTLDGCWQVAESIPQVYYQGFIIGLQAISRQGLVTKEQLEEFNQKVQQFADSLNAQTHFTNIDDFLAVAEPLDAVCARVDQAIPMHLVSRDGEVSGSDLRAKLEQAGFQLGADGAFHLLNPYGHSQFIVSALDNNPFSASSLLNQSYKGITMLFDIPHTPANVDAFARFMNTAITLSSDLDLDLVNDKLEVLSTEWLKNAETYIHARHEEMIRVNITPGSELSSRLFM